MPVQRGAKRRVNRNGIRTLEDERSESSSGSNPERRRGRLSTFAEPMAPLSPAMPAPFGRAHGDPRKPSGFAQSRHALQRDDERSERLVEVNDERSEP